MTEHHLQHAPGATGAPSAQPNQELFANESDILASLIEATEGQQSSLVSQMVGDSMGAPLGGIISETGRRGAGGGPQAAVEEQVIWRAMEAKQKEWQRGWLAWRDAHPCISPGSNLAIAYASLRGFYDYVKRQPAVVDRRSLFGKPEAHAKPGHTICEVCYVHGCGVAPIPCPCND